MLKRATIGLASLSQRIDEAESHSRGGAGSRLTDANGHFHPVPPVPLLGGRYRFLDVLARGSFAVLVRAEDTFNVRTKLVAIKIMHLQLGAIGHAEAQHVRQLNRLDPEGHVPIIRCLDVFEFHEHVCLVFELLVALPLKHCVDAASMVTAAQQTSAETRRLAAIRKLAVQALTALVFVHRHGMIHADIKPENILLRDSLARSCAVKLADFGNTVNYRDEKALKQYYADFNIQSLLYRAPEVFFGIPFGEKIDVWSMGCLIAELFLDRPLFVGTTPAEVVAAIHRVTGDFPVSFRTGSFWHQYRSRVAAPASDKADGPKTKLHRRASRLLQLISSTNFQLGMFLAGMLDPDSATRLTSLEALRHPFLSPTFPFWLLAGSNEVEPASDVKSEEAAESPPKARIITPKARLTGEAAMSHVSPHLETKSQPLMPSGAKSQRLVVHKKQHPWSCGDAATTTLEASSSPAPPRAAKSEPADDDGLIPDAISTSSNSPKQSPAMGSIKVKPRVAALFTSTSTPSAADSSKKAGSRTAKRTQSSNAVTKSSSKKSSNILRASDKPAFPTTTSHAVKRKKLTSGIAAAVDASPKQADPTQTSKSPPASRRPTVLQAVMDSPSPPRSSPRGSQSRRQTTPKKRSHVDSRQASRVVAWSQSSKSPPAVVKNQGGPKAATPTRGPPAKLINAVQDDDEEEEEEDILL